MACLTWQGSCKAVLRDAAEGCKTFSSFWFYRTLGTLEIQGFISPARSAKPDGSWPNPAQPCPLIPQTARNFASDRQKYSSSSARPAWCCGGPNRRIQGPNASHRIQRPVVGQMAIIRRIGLTARKGPASADMAQDIRRAKKADRPGGNRRCQHCGDLFVGLNYTVQLRLNFRVQLTQNACGHNPLGYSAISRDRRHVAIMRAASGGAKLAGAGPRVSGGPTGASGDPPVIFEPLHGARNARNSACGTILSNGRAISTSA